MFGKIDCMTRPLFAGLALLGAFAAQPACARPALPVLVKEIPIPHVMPGDFDQMAADLRRNRLYVSVEDSNFIAVFNLRSGKYLTRITGVKLPHRLAVEQPSGDLIAAIGGGNQVNIYSPDLKLLATVPTGVFPDGGVLDQKHDVFYVGSRLGPVTEAESQVQEINLHTLKIVSAVSIPAATLKDEIIDKARGVLFVSMRDKNEVAVINLKTHAIAALWAPPGLTKPVPMALDQKHHLLFVGGRMPGKLFVLDSDTGALLQMLDSCDISDSMWFDSANNMLYVSGHTGLSIYRVTGRKVVPVAMIDNKAGKSSLLVKQLMRLYVAQPKTADQRAELRIYRVR